MSPFNFQDANFHTIHLVHAPMMAQMHALCFEKAWGQKSFEDMLLLPNYKGLINAQAFVLCSVVGVEAEVITLGVLPSSRHQGVGFQMMMHLADYLRTLGVEMLFLEVNEENKNAIALYQKCGFEQTGRRPKYYQTALGVKDALLFLKKIKK